MSFRFGGLLLLVACLQPPLAAARHPTSVRRLAAAVAPAAASCQSQLTACATAKDALAKQLSGAKSSAAVCATSLRTCNAAKATLSSQLNKLRTQAPVITKTATGTVASAATDCDSALAAKDAQIAALSQQLAAANATIAQLQQQLTAAQQRVAAAEAALDAALADGVAKAEQSAETIASLQDQAETAVAAQEACEQRVAQLASVEQRLAATSAALNATDDMLAQTRAQLDACDAQREAAVEANETCHQTSAQQRADAQMDAVDLAGCKADLGSCHAQTHQLQDALTMCTAAKTAANTANVACQNRVIDLQQANETSSAAAGEAHALLDDCETRLHEALVRLMPPA